MHLGQSLRTTLHQSVQLRQRLQLTQGQKFLLRGHLLKLQLAFVGALREERYEPEGRCPPEQGGCGGQLTPVQIVSGFRNDPADFTTRCVHCGTRFEPNLRCIIGDGDAIYLKFYCDLQTLDQLRPFATVPPADLLHKEPGIVRSALIHFGSVRTAFEKIGVAYPFEELPRWKEVVRPFLGRVPDRRIAAAADVSVLEVRELRKNFGIKAYRVKQALQEAEVAGTEL